MQHIREHEFVDVLGMVSEMRSHRLSMVQTEVSPCCLQGLEPRSCSTAGHQGLLSQPCPLLFLLWTGAVRVHPSVRPADVAEEEAAAVPHL